MNLETSPHIPVLLKECLEGLDIQATDTVLDGTLGYGGHSEKILENLGENGILIGLDQDPTAISYCKEKFKNKNILIEQKNFSQFEDALEKHTIKKISKGLFDLGISSLQLDTKERGFSFLKSGPLDMRMNTNSQKTALHILKTYSKEALSNIFFKYGELHQNKYLCENIHKYRKQIEDIDSFIEVIKKSYHFNNNRVYYMKTLSQIFQALRIEVNEELTHLETLLQKLLLYLENNGRVAIITFHSIEDRIVKNFIRQNKATLTPLNKKVIVATKEEFQKNSRSKAAKLRLFRYQKT